MATRTQGRGSEITGRHVLFGVVLFFGVIIAVNAVFLTLAIGSFPGERQKKSYLQGRQYNAVLEERAAQAERGWRAVIEGGERLVAADAVLAVRVLDRAGAPVRGLDLAAVIARPATDAASLNVALVHDRNGLYRAALGPIDPGAWDVVISGADAADRRFEAERRLWAE